MSEPTATHPLPPAEPAAARTDTAIDGDDDAITDVATTSDVDVDRGSSVTATVGPLDDQAVGTMRLARVGERRVAVIRTATGVYALDNACPHQGYGLVTGALDGDLVTCQWHNWKFRVTDGRCVLGEEDVACHGVDVVDGEVRVTVVEPTVQQRREALWPSLLRGVDRHYTGQIARDSARLLDTGVTPTEIVAAAMVHAAPRIEDGIGHELAMAVDCLHLAHLWDGLEATLPGTHALAGIAETARDRPVQPLPAPDATIDLLAAIEREDADAAMAAVLGRIDADGAAAIPALRADFIEASSTHHLGYGHGAIYTQKTFELLDLIGDEHAPALLPWLALTLVNLTREDVLPYMRKTTRAIEAVGLEALASASDRHETGWADDGRLLTVLLDADEAPIDAAVAAVIGGAGIEGLLDAVALGASVRLLRHDPTVDFDIGVDFGWLDITHALTYANAARWAWRAHPGPATARLALFTVWLLHDSGRAERWGHVRPRLLPDVDPTSRSLPDHDSTSRSLPDLDESRSARPDRDASMGSGNGPTRPAGTTARQASTSTPSTELLDAILDRRPDDATALVLAVDPHDTAAVTDTGDQLARAAMADRAGSFIVAAHVVKLAEAARREADETGSMLPLAAAARFAAAPRLERFVAAAAAEAVGFVRTGTPPRR